MQTRVPTSWHDPELSAWTYLPAGTECELVLRVDSAVDDPIQAAEIEGCLQRHRRDGEHWVAVKLDGKVRCIPRSDLAD